VAAGQPDLAGLAAVFEPAQPLELIILCGWYPTLSTVITSVRLPLEPWAAVRFPRSEQRTKEGDQV
jgi:hypothetical protein